MNKQPTPLVAGNWKMNGSRQRIAGLLDGIADGVLALAGVEVAVFPPYVYLEQVAARLRTTSIRWGAQNVADRDEGPFTGEVSESMLREFGCSYAIVGHSERRSWYGESDQLVARRYARALAGGLRPLLCVGETAEERQQDRTHAVLVRQLDAVFDAAGTQSFQNGVVAYEPVWAIGTGHTATPEQAQDAHRFIRHRIAEVSGSDHSGLRILYGGSVTPDNAAQLFAMPDINGGLIGGASLKVESFIAICKAAV